MIKYIIIIVVGIVIIWLSVVLVRSTGPKPEPVKSDDEIIENIQNRMLDPHSQVEPEMVTVTIGDSLYHKPDCEWIGSLSEKMTLRKAKSLGFHPCPDCIRE